MLKHIRQLFGLAAFTIAIGGMAHAIPTVSPFEDNPEKRCYANAITPALYTTEKKRVEIHPGYDRIRQTPAVYDYGRVRVMVKDADFSYQTQSPTYAFIYEDVLVTPAREEVVNIPAKYETWTETVEIEPAKTIWKRGRGLYGHQSTKTAINTTEHADKSVTEILCKVTIPAKKRIVHHTRMVSPPRRETRTIPARYERVARQVVQRPAFARKIHVSAEFASLPYQTQLIASRTEIDRVPATYADIDQEVLIAAAEVVRAEVLCDQYASRETVRELQSALVERGYSIRIDGIYGPETQGAMEAFQRDNQLSRGYMTLESIHALNVSPSLCLPERCSTSTQTQRTVIAAQAALSAAGYFAAQDGIHGPETQAALEKFQIANNLEVGFLSAETMTRLNLIERI